MQPTPYQLIQIALISGGFALGGAMLGALLSGFYNLRAKRNEYVNDYYKKVIDRRLAAYERLEDLILSLKTVVLDEDAKPYHVLFSHDWQDAYDHIYNLPSLWLSNDALEKTQALNYLMFRVRPTPNEAIEFGKQNYHEISKLRSDLEKILAIDMLDFHNVTGFLKKKQHKGSSGSQEFEISPSRGLVAVSPSTSEQNTINPQQK